MSLYGIVFTVLLVILCVVVAVILRGARRRAHRRAQLRREYGKAPDVRYEEGDIEQAADYYLYKLARGGGFSLDEITWNDLNLDGLYVDVNGTQTNCGAGMLYDMLRTPVLDGESYDRRKKIVDALDSDEKLRLKLQMIFSALGRKHDINLCEDFVPTGRGAGAAAVYCTLAAVFLGLVVFTVFSPLAGGPFLLLSFITNSIVYVVKRRGINDDLLRLSYSIGMIAAAKKLGKIKSPEIAEYVSPLEKALAHLGKLASFGSVTMTPTGNDLNDIFGMLFLWDLICYEIAKYSIGEHYEELMAIFETVGGLDAAVSIASYRRRCKGACLPEIDFESPSAHLEARGLKHPLIENAVPNDFLAEGSVLLTGSNASGKSTYLKTVALNAVLAQTVGLCFAESYKASALRVYSSMALRDDLAAGESYYIVEIKSIGRILDAAASGEPALCIIDEVLRGTNTVERIAASSEILRYIASNGALCVAATHDIELASLLKGEYLNCHFQEYIEGDEMTFDYKLREGPSKSRNAIRLLEIMGYDPAISKAAALSAERFLESGKWREVGSEKH